MRIWRRVILKQTVERLRKLGLLHKQSSEISPHSGREGETLTALPVEGATQAPVIWSTAERERLKPLERMSVFVGNSPTPIYILMDNPGQCQTSDRNKVNRGAGDTLKPVLANDVIHLDSNGPFTGQDKLRLEGKDHAFLENNVVPRCNNGKLINLKTQTMADKADLSGAKTHEVFFKTGRFRLCLCPVE
jgi:hypothetical protein